MKYTVVKGHIGWDNDSFVKEVSDLLNKGWKLYGNPFAKGYQNSEVAQALIKEE